jgi:hypothetical protein
MQHSNSGLFTLLLCLDYQFENANSCLIIFKTYLQKNTLGIKYIQQLSLRTFFTLIDIYEVTCLATETHEGLHVTSLLLLSNINQNSKHWKF